MGWLTPVRRGLARLLGRPPAWRDQTPDERVRLAAAWGDRHRAEASAMLERLGIDPTPFRSPDDAPAA